MAKFSPDDLVKTVMSEFETIGGIQHTDNIATVKTPLTLLNTITGGGIPLGKIILLCGSAGGGKSTLAAQLMAGMQNNIDECLCAYLDVEQAVSKDRLTHLGCDPQRTILETRTITVEQVMEYISGLVAIKKKKKIEDMPFMIVWDSESVTFTNKHLQAPDPAKVLGHKARMLCHVIPQMASYCSKYNITLVIISQLRDKVDLNPYAPKGGDLKGLGDKTITGGNIMKFMPFLIGHVRPREALDDTFDFSGTVTELVFVKNKNYAPNIKADLILDYTNGFSEFWTKHRVIQQGGGIKGKAWQYLENDDTKFRKKEIESVYNDPANETFRQHFEELYEKYEKELVSGSTKKRKSKKKEDTELEEEDDDDSDIVEQNTAEGGDSDV